MGLWAGRGERREEEEGRSRGMPAGALLLLKEEEALGAWGRGGMKARVAPGRATTVRRPKARDRIFSFLICLWVVVWEG